jgi:hypothetical protein
MHVCVVCICGICKFTCVCVCVCVCVWCVASVCVCWEVGLDINVRGSDPSGSDENSNHSMHSKFKAIVRAGGVDARKAAYKGQSSQGWWGQCSPRSAELAFLKELQICCFPTAGVSQIPTYLPGATQHSQKRLPLIHFTFQISWVFSLASFNPCREIVYNLREDGSGVMVPTWLQGVQAWTWTFFVYRHGDNLNLEAVYSILNHLVRYLTPRVHTKSSWEKILLTLTENVTTVPVN